jgi:predicted RNA-binding protein YlqC (UPF0109 family)
VIQDLVEFVAKALVTHPDEVEVKQTETEAGEARARIDVALKVAEDDYGRVIGRNGQTIDAIRRLARVAGRNQDVDVNVEVVDIEEWNNRG